MATQTYVDGVTLSAAAEWNKWDTAAYCVLSGVAGTNTITATGPANYSYSAATPPICFIPAVTNTGATTMNVTPSGASALGAKNIFWNGAACVGGELRANVPAALIYDGTQLHIIANGFNAPFLDTHAIVEGSSDSTKKVRIEADGLTTATTRVLTAPDRDLTIGGVTGTPQATTSGTSADYTGIPSGTKKITYSIYGFSTNGTSNPLFQLGDSGGVEVAGYLGAGSENAGFANYTTGFGFPSQSAANVLHGSITLTLVNAATFTWVASGVFSASNGAAVYTVSGSKSLSAELDRVRLTTVNGTDAFDAGAVNIYYE